MIDRSKKIVGRFYALPSGRRPVRDWLLALSREDRRIIGRDIQQVEFGWPIGMPYCRPLGRGLWEGRSDLTGNRIARVIFCISDGEMVLCTASRKRRRKRHHRTLSLRECENGRSKDEENPKKEGLC
jgi:Phage derived protein Gp49-like (DUF891)